MNLSDVKIVMWISYDYSSKEYDIALGFEGLDSCVGVYGVEDEFIRDMQGVCYDPVLLSLLSGKSPDSGFHRRVLRKIQKDMQRVMKEKSNIYWFDSIVYDIDMCLLPLECLQGSDFI